MEWHKLPIQLAFEKLESSAKGLSSQQASARLATYGRNELKGKKKKTALTIFFKQFADVMITVLLVAALISVILREYTDTIVILCIVLLNAIIGLVQEYKAEKAIDLLRVMANPSSAVQRDGQVMKIDSLQLVPGDVINLDAGTKIPADLRLFESHSLRVDESSLTGESVPVDKTTLELLPDKKYNLSDYTNIAFKGTYVTGGRGQGLVVATGMDTELGKIAGMLEEESPVTPLQLRMKQFSKKLTSVIIAISLFVFLVGLFKGNSALEMLMLSMALAVAAIPEALPAIITISLALGAKDLVSKNALIRRLFAVETLGSVSVICTDKTGTLTQNKMRVAELWLAEDNDHDISLMQALHLNHDIQRKDNDLLGDATEVAVLLYLIEQNEYNDKWVDDHERLHEIPFDSERKMMTTIHTDKGGLLVITKGAAESVLGVCENIRNPDKLKSTIDLMSSRGLRVLAYAYSRVDEMPEAINSEQVEKGLNFLGLAGLIDLPREEVKASIQECKNAGITTIMITGDHPATASYIAEKVGVVSSETDSTLTGLALDELSDERLLEKIDQVKVYARVSPAQKLRIVKALQQKGHFVAMTGDGVNDAPSIKAANIGIAMGITGTDVTKEAAQMILLDDNFATIVNAVKQGRRIYQNIEKVIIYVMSGNLAELLLIVVAPLLGLPLPLLAVQILWINLVSDGLPAMALIPEPAEKDIMSKPPRDTKQKILTKKFAGKILFVGTLLGSICIASQLILIDQGFKNWQTMIFTILCFAQLWQALIIRSNTEPIFKRGLPANPYVLIVITFTGLLQLLLIYVPSLQTIFHTQKLSLSELVLVFGISVIGFVVQQLIKAFFPALRV